MSQTAHKFIAPVATLAPINSPVGVGDSHQAVLNKLQGQLDALKLLRTEVITTPSASFSTAATTVGVYPVEAASIAPGATFEIHASLRNVKNGAAANLVASLVYNGTTILTLTQALGGTANAAPGRPVEIAGFLTFVSATAAEAYLRAFTNNATAFDAGTNTAAAVAVATGAAANLELRLNTTNAGSTIIARQVTIKRLR